MGIGAILIISPLGRADSNTDKMEKEHHWHCLGDLSGGCGSGLLGIDIGQSEIAPVLKAGDLNQTLLDDLLSFLLCAGALQIKF